MLSARTINELLDQRPDQVQGSVLLKIGGLPLSLKFSDNPTSASGARRVPTFREQLSLLSDMAGRSMGDPTSLKRMFERSQVTISNEVLPMGTFMQAIQKSAGRATGATRSSSLKNLVQSSYISNASKGESVSNVDVAAAIGVLDKTWLSALKHTNTLESIYMQIDNPKYLDILADYHKDAGAMAVYQADKSSTEASMGHGIRCVVIGKECTTPQGLIQSSLLMAKPYMDNTTVMEHRTQSAESALHLEQYAAGSGVIAAKGALSTLRKQLEGREWGTNSLISEHGLDSIENTAEKILEMDGPDREIMIRKMVVELGRSAEMSKAYDADSSPSP